MPERFQVKAGLKTSQYVEYPLEYDYLEIVTELDLVKICIIGKDPYPQNAAEVPFLKKEWSGLEDKREAGYHILNSLGLWKTLSELKSQKISPIQVFHYLARNGIVFLNASYHYLNNEPATKWKHFWMVNDALTVNLPILNRAEHVLFCGDAYNMMNWVVDGCAPEEGVPHPSQQGLNALKGETKSKWHEEWDENKLKIRLLSWYPKAMLIFDKMASHLFS